MTHPYPHYLSIPVTATSTSESNSTPDRRGWSRADVQAVVRRGLDPKTTDADSDPYPKSVLQSLLDFRHEPANFPATLLDDYLASSFNMPVRGTSDARPFKRQNVSSTASTTLVMSSEFLYRFMDEGDLEVALAREDPFPVRFFKPLVSMSRADNLVQVNWSEYCLVIMPFFYSSPSGSQSIAVGIDLATPRAVVFGFSSDAKGRDPLGALCEVSFESITSIIVVADRTSSSDSSLKT